ncbi:MAG: ABC transporter ATP-binding protein [Bacillota bacterium]|nr:ABC transporter ATP-binding protein [Bacillota bacterium]
MNQEASVIIDMRKINKGYMLGTEKVPVLKNVDFQVNKGEFVAILGPSGSGKTTLMNIIGCMDVCDDGEYFLEGQPIHDMQEKELGMIRNQKIGFVFQNYQLISTYDILQNIMMPLVVRGMSTKEAEEKSMPIIEMLGISHRLRHKPSELSGGQKQRASIARALVGQPALLLADEPTGALDTNSGKDVLALFKQLHQLGNTIVMITHDLNVAKSAERIVHIIDGCLE